MNPRGTLGLLGTGAMGTGIAQVAATHGWQVKLMDTDRSIAEKAIEGVGKRLTRLVEKGRIDSADATAAMDRLQVIDSSAGHGDCDVVIEAIVEDLSIKVDAMMPMVEAAPQDAIIATNTSSLSVTELGEKLGVPERICGMHFFNPAPIMQLVEVIPGRGTSSSITDRAVDVASGWGKHVARASDTPGFIVNRVARPYYLEAFRCLEDAVRQHRRPRSCRRRNGSQVTG